jgi:diacylglycerol kinase family enzyme
MKIAFLMNVSNHWLKKVPLLIREIDKFFSGENERFLIDRSQPQCAEVFLEKIRNDKFDRIVVVGGDGTLNRVVNYLQNADSLDQFCLGVIPFGTCNDFAKKLGYSSGEIERPIQAVLKNNFRKVSVAKVNRHCFINNAGFGRKNPTEKRKSSISAIREMEPVLLKARWNGGSLNDNFLMMLCANAPYFSDGLCFSKKSDPSDNRLEFYFVKKMSKFKLFLKLLLGRANRPLHNPRFSRNILEIQTSRLTLQADRPISIVTDGEPVEELNAIREAVFEIAGDCKLLLFNEDH